MAEAEPQLWNSHIQPSPPVWKADVWQHSRFDEFKTEYEVGKKHFFFLRNDVPNMKHLNFIIYHFLIIYLWTREINVNICTSVKWTCTVTVLLHLYNNNNFSNVVWWRFHSTVSLRLVFKTSPKVRTWCSPKMRSEVYWNILNDKIFQKVDFFLFFSFLLHRQIPGQWHDSSGWEIQDAWVSINTKDRLTITECSLDLKLRICRKQFSEKRPLLSKYIFNIYIIVLDKKVTILTRVVPQPSFE